MDKGGAFIGLEDALRADGHKVERVSLPPIAPVAVRAEALAEQVDAILAAHGVAKVNLIGTRWGARFEVSGASPWVWRQGGVRVASLRDTLSDYEVS